MKHCLLSSAHQDAPREVAGHEQALAQCRNWLLSHYPEATLVPKASTAEAARAAAENPGIMAVASAEAASVYGLEIIARDIADVRGNTTRFQVLAKALHQEREATKPAWWRLAPTMRDHYCSCYNLLPRQGLA